MSATAAIAAADASYNLTAMQQYSSSRRRGDTHSSKYHMTSRSRGGAPAGEVRATCPTMTYIHHWQSPFAVTI
jgi:hypothetical protein